jgi:hypothetical protein
MALWDLPDGRKATIEYALKDRLFLYGEVKDGDWAKSVGTNYDWKPGKWYTMRIQLWTADNKSYYAQWVREEGGEWLNTAIISYPEPGHKFTYSAMFQEDFQSNNKSRACSLKNAYARSYGTNNWVSWNEYLLNSSYWPRHRENTGLWSIDFNCDWGTGPDSGYLWMQSGGSDKFVSNGRFLPVTYTLSQPAKPSSPEWLKIDEAAMKAYKE